MQRDPQGSAEAKPQRSILPCNFRSAGRLSNESERLLRSMHDTFARNATNALDLFFGTPMEVKLLSLEQMPVRDCMAQLSPTGYVLPYSIAPMQGKLIAEFDSSLLFPIVDLLLGGSGESLDPPRELTDIDEELIRSVTEQITVQLERAWRACSVTLGAGASIKSSLVGQLFSSEERVLQLTFEITVARTAGNLRLVLPAAFSNALVRQSQVQSVHRNPAREPLRQSLRDRLLASPFTVSAELTGLRVPVGELVGLQPGSFLPFRTPVSTPVKLTLNERPLFEAVPVRSGGSKAAQLIQPCSQR